jgi:hypothetical protein
MRVEKTGSKKVKVTYNLVMKAVQGRFDKVEDNINLNGKNFSAVVEYKVRARGPKKISKLDLILDKLTNLEAIVAEHTAIFKRNNLK